MGYSELFFYGGIAVSAASLLSGLIAFLIFKRKRKRLNAKLDQEYGVMDKEGGQTHSR